MEQACGRFFTAWMCDMETQQEELILFSKDRVRPTQRRRIKPGALVGWTVQENGSGPVWVHRLQPYSAADMAAIERCVQRIDWMLKFESNDQMIRDNRIELSADLLSKG